MECYLSAVNHTEVRGSDVGRVSTTRAIPALHVSESDSSQLLSSSCSMWRPCAGFRTGRYTGRHTDRHSGRHNGRRTLG